MSSPISTPFPPDYFLCLYFYSANYRQLTKFNSLARPIDGISQYSHFSFAFLSIGCNTCTRLPPPLLSFVILWFVFALANVLFVIRIAIQIGRFPSFFRLFFALFTFWLGRHLSSVLLPVFYSPSSKDAFNTDGQTYSHTHTPLNNLHVLFGGRNQLWISALLFLFFRLLSISDAFTNGHTLSRYTSTNVYSNAHLNDHANGHRHEAQIVGSACALANDDNDRTGSRTGPNVHRSLSFASIFRGFSIRAHTFDQNFLNATSCSSLASWSCVRIQTQF